MVLKLYTSKAKVKLYSLVITKNNLSLNIYYENVVKIL